MEYCRVQLERDSARRVPRKLECTMLPFRMNRLRFRVADAAAELAGQAFLDLEVHVHQIRRTGYGRGLRVRLSG